MIHLAQIQEQLKTALKYCDKTQKSIADELGVSQQMISSYLNGKKVPPVEIFANLCRILDLDANDILCLK